MGRILASGPVEADIDQNQRLQLTQYYLRYQGDLRPVSHRVAWAA